MFKIFNNDLAIDMKKITAVYLDNIGTKNNMTYSVKVSMDNGDDWTLAEFPNDIGAAQNYFYHIVDKLNAE